jgi:hypothetical protein
MFIEFTRRYIERKYVKAEREQFSEMTILKTKEMNSDNKFERKENS